MEDWPSLVMRKEFFNVERRIKGVAGPGVKDFGAQGPARGRKVCSFMSGASRAFSKEQNWPALTSKSGPEERIPGDLVTGVGDKVKGKVWTLWY